MPNYDYLCTKCDFRFEVFQSFADDSFTLCDQAPITCPQRVGDVGGGGELRKVYGNVGLTFKGSGFYKTDNRTGGSDGSSGTTSSSSTSPSTPASTPSESSSPSTPAAAPAAPASSSPSGHGHSHGAGSHTH